MSSSTHKRRGPSGCLVVIIVVVLLLTFSGSRREEEAKNNAQQAVTVTDAASAARLAFDACDPSLIDLTNVLANDGEVVMNVHVKWSSNHKNDVINCCWLMLDMCDIIFDRDDVDYFSIVYAADLIDSFGNESTQNVFMLGLTKETAAQCNFPNLHTMTVQSTRRIIDLMDKKMMHPVIQDDIF